MLTRLDGRTAKPHLPLGLILSPTRELAVQISDVVGPLSRKVGLSTQVVAGWCLRLSRQPSASVSTRQGTE